MNKEPRRAGRVVPGDTVRCRVFRGVGVGVPTYGYPHDPAAGWLEVEGVYPYGDWDGETMVMLAFVDGSMRRIRARETVQVRS